MEDFSIPMQDFAVTRDLVTALEAEAKQVGAAMRRIVDAAKDGIEPDEADVERADAWLTAVGA